MLTLPSSLGPGIGPIIRGLLAHYLGWRSVFWFLVISSGVVFIVMPLLYPETCRKIGGDFHQTGTMEHVSFDILSHPEKGQGRRGSAETEPDQDSKPFADSYRHLREGSGPRTLCKFDIFRILLRHYLQ